MLRQALKMSMARPRLSASSRPTPKSSRLSLKCSFSSSALISSCLLPLWSEMTEQVHLLYDLSGPRGQKLTNLARGGSISTALLGCALEDPLLLEDAALLATFAVEWLLDQLKAPDARERASNSRHS